MNWIVLIEVATGKAIRVWKGSTFRQYDESEFHQYRVFNCTREEALVRAEEIFSARTGCAA